MSGYWGYLYIIRNTVLDATPILRYWLVRILSEVAKVSVNARAHQPHTEEATSTSRPLGYLLTKHEHQRSTRAMRSFLELARLFGFPCNT